MPSDGAYILLFDGDCRICRAFARAIHHLDVRRSLSVRPIQESRGLLGALPVDRHLKAAHVVAPDGRVSSGGEAMAALVAGLVAGPRFEERIRRSMACSQALGRAYAVLARLREQLSCAVVPASAGRTPE